MVTTERCTLETVNSSLEEFVDIFIKNHIKQESHDFVADQQSVFIEETNCCLLHKMQRRGSTGTVSKPQYIHLCSVSEL
jgi:hypothetical protein